MLRTLLSPSSILNQLVRFGLVGVVNTAVGFSVIVCLMTFARWSPVAANIGGYAVGLTVSYFLNRRFTFKTRKTASVPFVRYVGVFAICYGLNMAVLLLLIEQTATHPIIAQAVAMVAYSASFFILCRVLVFPAARN